MTPRAPDRAVASFDSATGMLRAISRALRGEAFPHLGQGAAQALPVRLSALLPTGLRRQAYARLGGTEGVPPKHLGDVDMETVAEWIVDHYERRPYPGVVIGSSNGAAVHLCTATGMPFLPQTLLMPVAWSGNDPDRPADAMEFGRRVAPPYLERNPDVELHHMHDGNQDRLMVSRMTYFRVKWTALPRAYLRFLTECLEPGAPVVVLADETTWPVTRVDDRHVFQTGACGGLTADEYINGSTRVARYLREQGSRYSGFVAPHPDGVSAEAEWGLDTRLAEDVRRWAGAADRAVATIRTPSPQALAAPTARLMRERIRSAGADGDRLLVESFVMLDPVQARRTGSVPYWSYFPVDESLRMCAEFVERAALAGDPYRDVDILLFPHGVASVGATPPSAWATELADRMSGRVRFVAGTPQRWPAHFDALGRYGLALRRLPSQPQSTSPLPVGEMLNALSDDLVRVEPATIPA